MAAGRIDEGEDALAAAKRELLEETGYEAEEFILWNAQQQTTKIDYAIYFFIAKGLKKVAKINPDNGEKIKLNTISLDELIDRAVNEYETFNESEIAVKFFEAKLFPEKKKELKELFKTINA